MRGSLFGSAAPGQLRVLSRTRRLATSRAVAALMLREMTTTYGRSPLGYLWAILQPVAGIALLTLVFSLVLRQPPLGKSFVLFYSTGMIPFLMYQEVNSKLAAAITFSRQLLIYPSVTLIDALVARFLLNYLTQLLIGFILFSGILLIYDTRTVLDLPAIALGFAMAGVLAAGIGVMNAFLFGYFPAWMRIWTVLNRPLFLISGAFFLFEDIPEPYRSYMWYNPLVHVIAQMRRGFYPFYEAEYVSLIYVFGLSLFLIMAGLVFLNRYALDILND
jgi:capsular polysaccharide transport system permease protein